MTLRAALFGAAGTVLFLHGNAAHADWWSFIAPQFADTHRCAAISWSGMGRSDWRAAYNIPTFAREAIAAIEVAGLAASGTPPVVVAHSFGGFPTLRLASHHPEAISGAILVDSAPPRAEGGPPPRAFAIWRAFSKWSPFFPIGRIVNAGAKRALSAAEIAAYDAPFPDSRYKAGARIFPSFVPFENNVAIPDQKRAWEVFEKWDKPFLCCFSDGDPVTRGGESRFIGRVPGTAGQPHCTLKGGHFIQENDPQGFVDCILKVR